MTLHEAQAQYALGLISASKYSNTMIEAIKNTTDQNEIVDIFWMIIDWENDLHDKKTDALSGRNSIKLVTAANCHFKAMDAFRQNDHVPAYLRVIVRPLANCRPLPEKVERLYPRNDASGTESPGSSRDA